MPENKWSWEHSFRDSDLSSTQKLILFVLNSHMAADGTGCWPSINTIAEESSLHRVTVVREVKKLEKLGWIEKCPRPNNQSTLYKPQWGCSTGLHHNGEVVAQDYQGGSTGLPQVVAQDYPNISVNKSLKKPEDQNTAGCSTTPRPGGKTGEVWKTYSIAYQNRYGTPPIRNASVNAKLSKFVDRVGKDDAPHIAAYYLTINNRFYAQKLHPVGLLLSDAEALSTQWKTNTVATETGARQADRTQNNQNVYEYLMRQLEAGEL